VILGRTEEGLIKIKTDDPLGLRAVPCACCCSFVTISTELADVIEGKTQVRATFDFPAFVCDGTPVGATIGDTGILAWDGTFVFWRNNDVMELPAFTMYRPAKNCLFFVFEENGIAYRRVSMAKEAYGQSIQIPINGINVFATQTNESLFGIPLSCCPLPSMTITFS
jgi:hypothetical protein